MRNNLKKTVLKFKGENAEGRIICSVGQMTDGVTVDGKVYIGDALISAASRYVPHVGMEMTGMEPLYDQVVEDALLLAGVYISDSSDSDGHNKPGKSADKADGPTEEQKAVSEDKKTEPPAKEFSPDGKESTSAEPVHPEVPKESEDTKCAPTELHEGTNPEEEGPALVEAEADKPELTVEAAGAVVLELKAGVKASTAATLAEFLGHPLSELKKRKPSFIRLFASRAGTEQSILTTECEEAVRVLNGA